MAFSFRILDKRITSVTLIAGLLLNQASHAALVTASYEGIIDSDSGLGLIGEVMQVSLTYDDSIAPSYSWTGGNLNDSAMFDNFVTSMTVTIGSNSWNWNSSGTSSIFLYNDALISYSIGTEDRVESLVSDFSGPELVAGAHSYSSNLFLSDNNALDALTDGQNLPNPAPDADLFTRTEGNLLQFEFYTPNEFDPWGNYYLIETAGVSNTSPVPVPAAAWLFGSGLLGLIGVARRRNS